MQGRRTNYLQRRTGIRGEHGGFEMTAGNSNDRASARYGSKLPYFLTPAETADLLRTTRKAIYAMVERGMLAGVTRVGRRILIRRDDLLQSFDRDRAPSSKEIRR